MNKQFLILLLLAISAFGQQLQQVAIINAVDNNDSIKISDLAFLTDRLRETAVNILPKSRYGVMTTESIVAFLGKDQAEKACKEASCLADVGRKVNADYVAQSRVGRFGNDLALKTELYSTKSGNLVGSFTGNSKNIYGLLAIIDEKAPALFKQMPSVSGGSGSPSIAGGISGLETAVDYMLDGEKNYLVNFNTEPPGAILSFDGVPATSCPRTPCKVELREGNVRIVAVLEQYERADTTVSVKYNNQGVTIRLKSNFGVLDVRPAYIDGIGNNRQWNLAINGKPYSPGEVRLSPGKYSVKLSHDCYEDISFNVGINKDKREFFDMAPILKLKNGGLALSAERNGEPVSESVYVNGRRAGETPFSGTVPICARVEVGENREPVYVDLRHNDKVKYTHRYGNYYTAPQEYSGYSYVPQSTSAKPSNSSSSSGGTKWGFTMGMPLYIFDLNYNLNSYDDFFYTMSNTYTGVGTGFFIGPRFGILFNDVVSLNFESNFIYKYMTVNVEDLFDPINIEITEFAMSIPVLFKISGENYYAEGGIQYDIPFSTNFKVSSTSSDEEYEDEFSTRAKNDFGIVLGTGWKTGGVDFGTRIIFGMTDFDEYKEIDPLFTIQFTISALF